MSFKDLDIKLSYISCGEENIAKSFLVPALRQAKRYRRSVGFFSSGVFGPIIDGVVALSRNGGKIELIASPQLTNEDIDAINLGYQKREEIINAAFSRDFIREIEAFDDAKLQLLVALIANGTLDIKIAVTDTAGIYHDKLGILEDFDGNIVVFYGSANESLSGYKNNYEKIRVVRSWNESDLESISDECAEFDSLWLGTNTFVKVYNYKESARSNLLKGGRPKADPMDIINELKRRYANAPVCKSVKELSEQNPDLAPKFKNMQNQSEKFFGMKFVSFLIQEGILAGENKGRTMEDPAVVFAALKNKYAAVPFSGSLDNLKKENLDINWAQLQKYSTNLGTTLKKHLISEGIMEDDSVASLLENVIKELKQRYSEGVKLPQNITELKEQNKDLELKSLSSWIYQIYGKAATDFLIENGILAAEKSEAEQLEELMQELKKRYNDQKKKEVYLADLKTKNSDLPISNLGKWLKKLNIEKSATQYLISQNILRDLAAEREEEHRKWLEELRLKYTPICLNGRETHNLEGTKLPSYLFLLFSDASMQKAG